LKQYKPWFNELFKIIGTKKAGWIAMVAETKPNRWTYVKYVGMWNQ
jgi:hypothetical protein